jgi:hypothetical protein
MSNGMKTPLAHAADHPDDIAVDAFAAAMKAKLAAARAKGRGGWRDIEECPQQRLSDMLREHVAKGDPRDVANFCMFLQQRGESILSSTTPPQAETNEAAPVAAYTIEQARVREIISANAAFRLASYAVPFTHKDVVAFLKLLGMNPSRDDVERADRVLAGMSEQIRDKRDASVTREMLTPPNQLFNHPPTQSAEAQIWSEWDENNPPPPGEYVVYHSRFKRPGEKVWSFRASGNGKFAGPDKVRWSYTKGQCVWFNEGNWQTDGPPELYCPLPRYQPCIKSAVSAHSCEGSHE